MKTEDDIRYCKTDGVPNEVLISTTSKEKIQSPTCLTNPERYKELLERDKEE